MEARRLATDDRQHEARGAALARARSEQARAAPAPASPQPAAAVTNPGEVTTHGEVEALAAHINRDLLSVLSPGDDPPAMDDNLHAPGEIDIGEWAVSRTMHAWQEERSGEPAPPAQLGSEMDTRSPDLAFNDMVNDYSGRMLETLTDVGCTNGEGVLTDSIAALGHIAARIAHATLAAYIARALNRQSPLLLHLLDRLIYSVEGKKAGNQDLFRRVRAASQLSPEARAEMVYEILTSPASAPASAPPAAAPPAAPLAAAAALGAQAELGPPPSYEFANTMYPKVEGPVKQTPSGAANEGRGRGASEAERRGPMAALAGEGASAYPSAASLGMCEVT